MARSKEVGSVYLTFALPLKAGVRVYELSEELNCSANKVLQTLCKYALERAYVSDVSKDIKTILFKDVADA